MAAYSCPHRKAFTLHLSRGGKHSDNLLSKEHVHTDTFQSGITPTSARGWLVLLCSSISRKLTKHGAEVNQSGRTTL